MNDNKIVISSEALLKIFKDSPDLIVEIANSAHEKVAQIVAKKFINAKNKEFGKELESFLRKNRQHS